LVIGDDFLHEILSIPFKASTYSELPDAISPTGISLAALHPETHRAAVLVALFLRLALWD